MACNYKVTTPSLYELNRYGLLNPAALLWELQPLSFVADWFTGLGSFLQALSLGFGLRFQNGYQTTFVNGDFDVLHRVAPNVPVKQGSPYAKVKVHSRAMNRTIDIGFVPPPVYFRVDLNLSQAIASASLITAILRL